MRANKRIIKLNHDAVKRSVAAEAEKLIVDSQKSQQEKTRRQASAVAAQIRRREREKNIDSDDVWHQREGRKALVKLNKQNSVYHARLAACKEVLRDLDELPVEALLHAYPESIRHHGVAVIHDAVYFLKYERNAALKEAALKRIV